jgi:hypothetical protein
MPYPYKTAGCKMDYLREHFERIAELNRPRQDSGERPEREKQETAESRVSDSFMGTPIDQIVNY